MTTTITTVRRMTPLSLAMRAVLFETVEELAAYWKVSPRKIYYDIEKGAITVLRLPGGTMRIPITVALEYGRPNT